MTEEEARVFYELMQNAKGLEYGLEVKYLDDFVDALSEGGSLEDFYTKKAETDKHYEETYVNFDGTKTDCWVTVGGVEYKLIEDTLSRGADEIKVTTEEARAISAVFDNYRQATNANDEGAAKNAFAAFCDSILDRDAIEAQQNAQQSAEDNCKLYEEYFGDEYNLIFTPFEGIDNPYIWHLEQTYSSSLEDSHPDEYEVTLYKYENNTFIALETLSFAWDMPNIYNILPDGNICIEYKICSEEDFTEYWIYDIYSFSNDKLTLVDSITWGDETKEKLISYGIYDAKSYWFGDSIKDNYEAMLLNN